PRGGGPGCLRLSADGGGPLLQGAPVNEERREAQPCRYSPPLTCGADRWSACTRGTMTERRSTPRTPAPWPGTSWPPGPGTSTWWTWTAPRTAPWLTLTPSPPL